MLIDKSRIQILKSFQSWNVPNDFEKGFDNIFFLDELHGIVDSVLHKDIIDKNKSLVYNFFDRLKDISKNVKLNKLENLEYYYLLKLIILVLNNYL